MPVYNPAGLRTIRPNQPNEATEIDLGGGKAIQMPGKGIEVEKVLRGLREERNGKA